MTQGLIKLDPHWSFSYLGSIDKYLASLQIEYLPEDGYQPCNPYGCITFSKYDNDILKAIEWVKEIVKLHNIDVDSIPLDLPAIKARYSKKYHTLPNPE
jgi:hypothetical protein